MDKAPEIADAWLKIDESLRCVPHYTPSKPQQGIFSKKFLNKTPKELRYIERSVLMKEVKNQNLWNFQIGVQESMSVLYG